MNKTLTEVVGEEHLNKMLKHLGYLWERWQDEKEYEDWKDYIIAAKKVLPKDCIFISLSKRPFEMKFKLSDGRVAYIKITSREASWGFYKTDITNPMGEEVKVPSYFNEADGYTYWLKDGELIGAPTFKDGTVDIKNASPCAEWDMVPFTVEERKTVMAALNKKVLK